MKKVVIVGGGFAGLNAAKQLGNSEVNVTLIDKNNYHLFQPLLYQVAIAGLSPADIAVPIRGLLSGYKNIRILNEEIIDIQLQKNQILSKEHTYDYDYLVLSCGAQHSYFGNDSWQEVAPGLKTIEQATEIRRRVLAAFESAEMEPDREKRKTLMTFVIVGGGPTGVELAGAIGELSRYTLSKDFKNIDPKLTRIIVVEAGPRILPMFCEKLASKATRDLEKFGVQVWTSSFVTKVDHTGVEIGNERINAATILWAAGVQACNLNENLNASMDNFKRVKVTSNLTLQGFPNVFVAGDQAHFADHNNKPLPGTAPVALQQGKYIGKAILNEIKGKKNQPFNFIDKGQMATIGRKRAIVEKGSFKISGFIAWIIWLTVHIYYLTGFKNRIFVLINWAWSYFSFKRGARLIISKEWMTKNQELHQS